ncbi:biliverdin-producing heme oxygenase [Acidisoma cellulosilytica]|uniref:Biliverdin-producing heme oxygenase n=1 Tax=Acidisoma cellulosilyticum TaxID=2802395 RepID=A0A963Z1F4_9PROT|nr:biliverdin-producing heme oxygenase [Acidisoma cellulosilyticum]MCB8880058.1 biliverdin-producing heme oxygenase [Acidisoma cellulosilyticum]
MPEFKIPTDAVPTRQLSQSLAPVRSDARTRLRAATASAHAEVDRIFTRFDLTTLAGYSAFLSAHAAALLPTEAWLDAHAAKAITDWPSRRRAHYLTADLAALGDVPPPVMPFDSASTPAAVIGVLYVVEGSRLGGRVLARRLSPGLPATYLTPPSGDAPSWPSLLQRLDDLVTDTASEESALAAALLTFDRFARAGELSALGCTA